MRREPKPVPPITHNGIRYEAPHWRAGLPLEPGEDSLELAEEARMQATMVNAMARGGAVDLSPEWIKSTLLEAGHDPDLVERTVEKMAVHRKLQEALMTLATSVTQMASYGEESRSDQSPLGYATDERLRPLLEKNGLTPEQIQMALNFLKRQKIQMLPEGERPSPQDGGYVVAFKESSDEPLWCVQVYETEYSDGFEKDDQEIFITEMSVEGDRLTVKDERDRTHSICLKTRTVG